MERPGVLAVGIAPPRQASAAPGAHRPFARRTPATVDAGTPDGPTVMAVTARERVSETAARGWARPRRAVSVLVVALISLGAVIAPTASAAETGGTSGTGRPQPAPSPADAGFAAPPVGNTFPVPVESGVIAKVTDEDVGKGGLSLWLLGDSGNAYYYAHNSANLVRVGQRVARGQVIARVGHTGNAATTPPHIHFQINRCGELSSDEPCTISPYGLLRGWPQELVDGGGDAVGWYTPVGSTFRLRTEGGSALPATRYGSPRGDVALAGDWNGDGRDTIGVYRTASNTFYLRDDAGKAGEPVRYGRYGDRRDTVALFRPADGTWLRLDGAGAALAPVRYGGPGDLPLAGDWDGDGRDGIGIYRPSSSTYHLKGFTDRRGPTDTTTARAATVADRVSDAAARAAAAGTTAGAAKAASTTGDGAGKAAAGGAAGPAAAKSAAAAPEPAADRDAVPDPVATLAGGAGPPR